MKEYQLHHPSSERTQTSQSIPREIIFPLVLPFPLIVLHILGSNEENHEIR